MSSENLLPVLLERLKNNCFDIKRRGGRWIVRLSLVGAMAEKVIETCHIEYEWDSTDLVAALVCAVECLEKRSESRG